LPERAPRDMATTEYPKLAARERRSAMVMRVGQMRRQAIAGPTSPAPLLQETTLPAKAGTYSFRWREVCLEISQMDIQ
jgi:hypothetical protein